MKILADSHVPYVKDYFGGYGELLLKPGRAICHEDVKEVDILLVRSITQVNEALLANTRVKFVGSVTAGADHLDTQWLASQGIAWEVATGFNAPPVADYVVSVIAALQQKKMLMHAPLRAGVIGVGNVGRLVAERLKLLHFEVILCDPLRAQQEKGFSSTPLEMLSDLDVISLHVPLAKTGEHPTFHFIDKAFLQRQKPGCVLINASRGAVVDSVDLAEHGKHLHWCFDVWEHEPNINKNILQHALLATPHIAGYSVQSKIRGIEKIYRLACQHHFISPLAITPISMPRKQLIFTEGKQTWQELILNIFNPLMITTMMRTLLLPEEADGRLFDNIRNQFNHRHEFHYTDLSSQTISKQAKAILIGLGVNVL